MATPEEIIQQRNMAQAAAADRHNQELKEKLEVMWSQIQTEAQRVAHRLKPKDYPGGELIEISTNAPTRKWYGKSKYTSTTSKLAAWKFYRYTNDSGDPYTNFYVGSDGKVYVGGDSLAKSLAISSDLAARFFVREITPVELTTAHNRATEALKFLNKLGR